MSRSGKVTVVGAGFYGSTTALRLAEYDIFETVVLTDIVEGKPEGLALDINQSRSIEGFETKVVGATTTADGKGYEATANSDVVVITAGLPRKPGMSRMDLIGVNAGIVRGVAENIAKHSPNAVLIVVSNPLDEMTALAQIASQFPRQRVMGQAGMLDTARFTHFVAEKLNVPVASVKTLTLGSHGDTMVPVPSRCTVDGKPLSAQQKSTILSLVRVMVALKLLRYSRQALLITHLLLLRRGWRALSSRTLARLCRSAPGLMANTEFRASISELKLRLVARVSRKLLKVG
jgi:malate dehydrogenase